MLTMLKLSLFKEWAKTHRSCVSPFKCKWAAALGTEDGGSRAHVLASPITSCRHAPKILKNVAFYVQTRDW